MRQNSYNSFKRQSKRASFLQNQSKMDTIQCTKIIIITLFQFCLWLFTIYYGVINLLIIHKKNNTKYTFLFICQLSKITIPFKKMSLVGSSTFSFEVIFYFNVHKINIISLSYTAYPIYHFPQKQPVNWFIFHLLSLNIFSTIFLFNYRFIKKSITKLHYTT